MEMGRGYKECERVKWPHIPKRDAYLYVLIMFLNRLLHILLIHADVFSYISLTFLSLFPLLKYTTYFADKFISNMYIVLSLIIYYANYISNDLYNYSETEYYKQELPVYTYRKLRWRIANTD